MYIEEDKNNMVKHNGRYDAKGDDFSNPSSPSKGNRSYRQLSFDQEEPIRKSIDMEDWNIQQNILRPFDENDDDDDDGQLTLLIKGDKKTIKRMLRYDPTTPELLGRRIHKNGTVNSAKSSQSGIIAIQSITSI